MGTSAPLETSDRASTMVRAALISPPYTGMNEAIVHTGLEVSFFMLLQSSSIFFASSGRVEKIARRDLVLKAADDLDSFLCLALHGFCRVKQHEATHAKSDKNHRDDGSDNGCNAALLRSPLRWRWRTRPFEVGLVEESPP